MKEQSLEEVMQRVYNKLSENQEPLGPEFRKVLEDNLWDLYDYEDDSQNSNETDQ